MAPASTAGPARAWVGLPRLVSSSPCSIANNAAPARVDEPDLEIDVLDVVLSGPAERWSAARRSRGSTARRPRGAAPRPAARSGRPTRVDAALPRPVTCGFEHRFNRVAVQPARFAPRRAGALPRQPAGRPLCGRAGPRPGTGSGPRRRGAGPALVRRLCRQSRGGSRCRRTVRGAVPGEPGHPGQRRAPGTRIALGVVGVQLHLVAFGARQRAGLVPDPAGHRRSRPRSCRWPASRTVRASSRPSRATAASPARSPTADACALEPGTLEVDQISEGARHLQQLGLVDEPHGVGLGVENALERVAVV